MPVEPGDQSPLEVATGWHSIWRMQFEVPLDGHGFVLEADVLDWGENCYLYRDGVQVAAATSPARFALADHLPAPPKGEDPSSAVIEAEVGWVGMRRAHLLDGRAEQELAPLEGTWEYHRALRRRRHPRLSSAITAVTALVFLAALVVELLQSVDLVTHSDWFAGISSWRFTSPWDLSLTANILITLLGAAALVVTALRLRRVWGAGEA